MKTALIPTLALAAAVAAPAFAQSTTPPSDTWRMPHERGFWGHAGFSFGQSKLDIRCPSGFSCDDKDQFWKLYAGGRFNNAIGLEVGVMNFGKFAAGGGETDGWGADAALVAGIPIGANSSIFGKLGLVYARMETSGIAPGFETGKERGFGARWGVGAQVGLTKQWALRADFDRYRVPLPGDHEDVEALTLGVQYTFR
jgi:opacity protein-like surface antigen